MKYQGNRFTLIRLLLTLPGKSCIITFALPCEVVVITMATTKSESDEQIPAVVLGQISTHAHAALRLNRHASMIVQSPKAVPATNQ